MFCFELIVMELLKIKNNCYSKTFLMIKSNFFILFNGLVLIYTNLLGIIVTDFSKSPFYLMLPSELLR